METSWKGAAKESYCVMQVHMISILTTNLLKQYHNDYIELKYDIFNFLNPSEIYVDINVSGW